jgi:agmatine deiminase
MSKEAEPAWRMPGEWEPHEATWIAWPHNRDDWPGKFAAIPWVYAEIVRHLHTGERVRILVNDLASERRCIRILRKAGINLQQIDFSHFPTDRVWTRDYGPMFVTSTSGQKAIIDWRFNAWAKYPDWRKDDRVAQKASKALGLPRLVPTWGGKRIVLEGGAIDANGAGVLLTTEECLLSPVQARNPGLSREELERVFAEFLGIKKTIWLGGGITGDDTHGHVDDLGRFVDAHTIVLAAETNSADANYAALRDNRERLRGQKALDGKPLRVVELPMPGPVIFGGQRLPASYANFYIANECVLVPTFNDVRDREALEIIASLFPAREVVGIHAVDLVWGLGTIHCMTQQEPFGVRVKHIERRPKGAAE